jgi:YD repeat-containing protein
MKKIVFRLAVILIVLISRNGLAQTSSQPFSSTYEVQKIPANPDVAQLGRFGDVPVDKYNGTANISIPVYEIDHDGLKIPIALKYNSSGIRVEQEASWVGLGWSLSDGITITREVNGYEDIYNSSDANARSVGWIYSRDYLFPNPEDNYTLPGSLSEMDLVEILHKKTTDYKVDLEPDFFTVNLPSGACKFTLPKIVGSETILTAVPSDGKNYKMLYDIVNREFNVTDPNGFVYYFTVKEMSTGYGSYESIDNYSKKGVVAGIRFPTFQGKQMISSWRVSSIKSPLGRELTFTYQNGFYFSFPHFTESQEILQFNYPSLLTAWNNAQIYLSQTAEPSASMSGSLNAFYVKNLTSISGDFGSVEFVLSNRSDLVSKKDKLALSGFNPLTEPWNTYLDFGDSLIAKKVDQIVIKNKANDVVKTANLTYSYFNSQWVGIESASVWSTADPFQCDVSYLRLKLDRVDIGDQKYLLEYNQPNSLPAKFSRSLDFWGFNNGKANSTKIPSFNRFYVNHPSFTFNDEWHEFFIRVTGGNRGADVNYGKIGILQKITYPTGGYTMLDYEGHKVSMTNITYSPTQNLSNGSGQLRFTNLTSSKDYKYSYQYMKLAKTPTYSLYDYNVPLCDYPVANSYPINTQFTINASGSCGRTVKIVASISCVTGCSQTYTPFGRAVWLVNVATGLEINVFDFVNPNPSLQKELTLEDGVYQLKTTATWFQSSPTVALITTATVYVSQTPPPSTLIQSEEFEVGGARLKSIANYQSDGTFVSKTNYLYDQYYSVNGQPVSNGKLMDELIFHSKAHNLFDYTASDYLQNLNGSGAILSSDIKIRTNQSANGSHIGYSLVREESVDVNGNKLGQIATEFMNSPNDYVMKPTEDLPKITSGVIAAEDFHTTFSDLPSLGISGYRVMYGSVYILGTRPISYDYSNGSVLSERVFDQSNNLVKETLNSYNVVSAWSGSGIGATAGKYPIVYFFQQYMINFQPYQIIQPGQFQLNLTKRSVFNANIEYLNGSQIANSTDYYYDNPTHLLMTRSSTSASDGNLYTTKYYYPQDLPSVPLMTDLVSKNNVTKPIITERYQGTAATPYATLLEKVQTFYSNTNSITGDVLPKEVFTYNLGDVTGQQRVLYEKYSNYGTLIQYRKSNENVPVSLLWGHYKLLPIAQVTNALVDQVAFTSFDEPAIPEGGWQMSGTLTSVTSKTGSKCLGTGGSLTKTGLANGDYVVGFWAKLITGSSGTVTINGTPITITDTNWKYNQVTKIGTSISLTNSNVYIDELRLYPIGAQMTSYTYKPLVGITSQTDANGKIQYFEYDDIGRLLRIKDTDGNIIKQFKYNYKNQ